ncbi:MAG: tRNA pseudouridine(13) synthase TruD [Pseudomonadota bacterium]|nr:tRNA pseudouridine(13) synthase TruD [Pseudomonadota bacterium]
MNRTARTPLPAATYKSFAEEFQVDETLGFEPEGSGDHLWLQVRKTGQNTAWVARSLAQRAECNQRDVGYSGLKDRHARTTQWFSLPDSGNRLRWSEWEIPGVELLRGVRHTKKLRRGSHRGNGFRIRLHCEDAQAVAEGLTRVGAEGCANLFGPQRFGVLGDNLKGARRWLRGQERAPKRTVRGIWYSALRSAVFNRVAVRRLARAGHLRPCLGDLILLGNGRSQFLNDGSDATLEARLRHGEVKISGPLWGAGPPPTGGAVQAFESEVAREFDWLAATEALDWTHDRRALWVWPEALEVETEAAAVWASFWLPKGSFATSVLSAAVRLRNGAAMNAGQVDTGPAVD